MPRKGRVDNRPRKRQQPGYVSPRIKDIVGVRFGAWVVLGQPARNPNGQTTWLCRCDCGQERVVVGQSLREGKTKSCGCKMGDYIATSRTTHGQAINRSRADTTLVSQQAAVNRFDEHGPISGRSKSTLYLIKQGTTYRRWVSMKKRVKETSPKVAKYYLNKGITVCERWRLSFESFLADMGECPEGLTLDRINPNGNYEPGNCRWADWKTQASNKSKPATYLCPTCGCKRRKLTWSEAG